MKIAVTGANGFLGAHLVTALDEAGHEPVAVVRRDCDMRGLASRPGVRRYVDPVDRSDIRQAFAGCETVVHCAARYSYHDTEADLTHANVELTRSVLDGAADAGVPRVVLTSSSVTCGSSAGPQRMNEADMIGAEWVPPYFRTKERQERIATEVAARRGTDLVIACPTMIIGGPDWRLVPSNAVLVRYLLDPTRTTYVGGCNVVAVDDVAQGVVLLAERGVPGERYLLGGENCAWRTLHALVSDLAGIDGPYFATTAGPAWLAAYAVEAMARALGRAPIATRAEARTVGRWFWYSSEKAAAIGFSARSARAAVAEALAWLVTSPHVPPLLRENLLLADEVYAAHRLIPGPPHAPPHPGGAGPMR